MKIMARIHCITHELFEDLGTIRDWIEKGEHSLSRSRLHLGEDLPQLDSFDFLILMGGSMSVNDEAKFPWLKAEKELIRMSYAQSKLILGICLGAQLIASAMGSKVYPNDNREIGWLPIELTSSAHQLGLFPASGSSLTVFHWHGETFDLPHGAELLASSKACKHQAFSLSAARVIGLQFHLEMTPLDVQRMLDSCDEELGQNEFVQSAEQIHKLSGNWMQCRELMFSLLDRIGEGLIKVASTKNPSCTGSA